MVKFIDPKIIQKELSKLTKNTNFNYFQAKQSRIRNRKQHDQNKEIKEKQKTLSKDRFTQYIQGLYKNNGNN